MLSPYKYERFSGWGMGYRVSLWVALGLLSALWLSREAAEVLLHPDSASYLEGFSYRAPIYPAYLKALGAAGAIVGQWYLAFVAVAFVLLHWVRGRHWLAAGFFLAWGSFYSFGEHTLFGWMRLYLSSILMEGLWISYALFLGLVWLALSRRGTWFSSLLLGLLLYLPAELSPRLALVGLLGFYPLVASVFSSARPPRSAWLSLLIFAALWGIRRPSEFTGIGTIGIAAQFSDSTDLPRLSAEEQTFWERVLSDPRRNTDGKKINGNTWQVAVPIYRELYGEDSPEKYDRRRMNAFFVPIAEKILVQSHRWWRDWARMGLHEIAVVLRRQLGLWLFVAAAFLALLSVRSTLATELFLASALNLAHIGATCFLAGAYDRYAGALLPVLYISLARAVDDLGVTLYRSIFSTTKKPPASVFPPAVYQ